MFTSHLNRSSLAEMGSAAHRTENREKSGSSGDRAGEPLGRNITKTNKGGTTGRLSEDLKDNEPKSWVKNE